MRLNSSALRRPELFKRIPIANLVCFFLVLPGSLWAQECSHHGQDLDGLTITQITIDNRDIFNTRLAEQNRWIHRAANDLHIKTLKQTIEGQLLFESQQAYSEQLTRETERRLRSNNYIHDARIESEEICGEGVELTVVSTDNWTLTPSISVSHSGGETRTSFEIEESNLLGLGTKIVVTAESDEDRDETGISYRDANWLGNFKILDLEFSDNSDGHLYNAELSLPFAQLDARQAWSVELYSNERENPIYEQGDIVGKVGEETDIAEFTYGWSDGLVEGSVSRYRLGFVASEQTFRVVDARQTQIPESTTSHYPFFEYQFLNPKFITKTNFLVMGVTEDIRLGTGLVYRIGWKDEALDSTQEGYLFELDYKFGRLFSEKTIGLFELRLNRETNSTIDDTGEFTFAATLYHYNDVDHSYLFSSIFETALNPELFERFKLGGSSGLRGYPNRYQNGDRKLALGLEKRVFFDWYPWQLLKFGAAAFVEAGSAWESGEDPKLLGDVGFGIRLVSTRQSNSKVLHMDIAFPLSDRDQVDDYQLFVKAKSEF